MVHRVYPQGYTVFVTREDINSINQGTFSYEEGEQLLRVALGSLNSAVFTIVVEGFKRQGDSQRANVVRSTLRDYFKDNESVEQIVAQIGPSQQAPNATLPRNVKAIPQQETRQVNSDSGNGQYTLAFENGSVVSCTCPSFTHRQETCKHMRRWPVLDTPTSPTSFSLYRI